MSRVAARVAGFPQSLGARFAALPARRQERIQDLGLGTALAVVNVVSLLPYRGQLHPLWLALLLVAAQGIPLTWRRSWPVPVMIVIGAARVAYDQIGFGFAPFPLGPAIAFYTVIDRSGPVWRWVTVGGVAAGITTSLAAPGHNEPYEGIFQVLIFLTALAAGVLSRTKRASLQAAQSRADRAEAELDRQTAQAAQRERTRIARELHDVVAHHVSLIAVQAEAAGSLLPGRPEQARSAVEVIGDTARQALTELRRLLGVLRGPSERPETAPSASLGEIGDVLDQVRGAGLPVDFEVVGSPGPLAPGVDLTAYRIVQEALTNTIRHSRATRAAVTLCYEPGYVTVSITDYGGRPDEQPARGGGQEARPPMVGVRGGSQGGRPPMAGVRGGSQGGRPPMAGVRGGSQGGRPPVAGVRGGSQGGRPPVADTADGGAVGPPGSLLTGSGLGLAGIAERVASCGGNLTVGPTPANGFAVTARLPAR